MIDIKRIRENPEQVKEGFRKKEIDCDAAVDRILELDKRRRELISSGEQAKAEQNKLSKQIPQVKKEGGDVQAILNQVSALKETIKAAEAELRAVEEEYNALMYSLPNLPDDDLVPGGKEGNQPIRYFGEPHTFDFEPKNHEDLCTDLGLIDYERGAKLSGSGFIVYRGLGARLEWALLNYFIDTHLADGYELVLVPHMLGWECGFTSGQFPKFEDDVYWIERR